MAERAWNALKFYEKNIVCGSGRSIEEIAARTPFPQSLYRTADTIFLRESMTHLTELA